MKPITKAVYGSMSLRNRAVTTSVFWGARPRETLREHQTRLEMSAQPTSSTTSDIPVITLSDDEEDRSEPEAMMGMIVKEEPIQRAPEDVQERISSSPEVPQDAENAPEATEPVRSSSEVSQHSEVLVSFESANDESPDESSMSSIIPDDPKISEDHQREDAEVQKTQVGRDGTPEDPKTSDDPAAEVVEAIEAIEPRKDQNQNLEFRTPTPDEPEDAPPVLEIQIPIQIPKDSMESGAPEEVVPIPESTQSAPSSSASPAAEKKPRAKRRYKEKGAEPVRKSMRGAPPEVAKVLESMELAGNYVEKKTQKRNVIVPTGINRVRFEFEKKDPRAVMDPKMARLNKMLAVDMEAPVGPEEEEEPEEQDDQALDDSKVDDKKRHMGPKSKDAADIKIHIGPKHQANEVEMATEPDEQPDRDELIWRAPDEEIELHYDDVRNKYWRAIWRQYEGHIPMEVALQHLMNNKYIMSDSLKTIDQTLKSLPQAFKPICQAQAESYDNKDRTTMTAYGQVKDKKGETAELGKRRISRRYVQEHSMKNYHIGEIQQFHYRWRKFYKNQACFFVCNCWEPLCDDIAYEPRWACSNCTAHLRPQPASTLKRHLCLICQTYRRFALTLPDMKDLVLHDFELQKVRDFERFQKESEGILTREQVEDLIEKETVERWRRLEMTEEEQDMVNIQMIKAPDRKLTRGWTPEEQVIRGKILAVKLKPFVLPHFSKCNCLLNKHHEKTAEERKRELARMDEEGKQKLEKIIRYALTKFRGDMKMVSVVSGAHLPELKKFLQDNIDTPGYKQFLKASCFERMKFPISNLPPKRPYDEKPLVAEFLTDLPLYVEPTEEEKQRIRRQETAKKKSSRKSK